MPTTVRFKTCYDYKTLAVANVCVDTDLRGQAKNKVCEPRIVSMGAGQGGPVAVISVGTRMFPHAEREDIVVPEFTIKIKNLGKGVMMSPGRAMSVCEGYEPSTELSRVQVSAVLHDQGLNCEKGYINVKQEKEIVCRLDEGVSSMRGTYLTQLILTLDYSYMNTISKNFNVQKRGIK